MCLEYVHSIFLFTDGAFLEPELEGWFLDIVHITCSCSVFLAKWSVFLSLKSLSSFCLEDVGVEVKLFSCFCLSSKLSAAAEQKE